MNFGTLSGGRTTATSGQDGAPAQPISSNSRVTTSLPQAGQRQETFVGKTPNSDATSTRAPNETSRLRPPLDLVPSQALNSQDEEPRTDASGARGIGEKIGQRSGHVPPTQRTKRKASGETHTTHKSKSSKAINDKSGPSPNSLTKVCNTQSTEHQALSIPSLVADTPLRLHSKSSRNQIILLGESATGNLLKGPRPPMIPRRSVGLSLFKPPAIPVGRRFKPIAARQRPPPRHGGHLESQSSITRNDTALGYLDFDSTVILAPNLLPIRLPPKLSQRKQVTVYALILSYTDPDSLSHCAQASRVLRYAGTFSSQ